MGDSSESEEFYDAEEFTPIKGSKRSSLCKNINISDTNLNVKSSTTNQKDTASTSKQKSDAQDMEEDVKHVVQDRQRFQELRRCLQNEEEDEGIMDNIDSVEQQPFTLEHPFKIIAHDTMSMQSMTSLGRIGRILSGASDSHSNIRDNIAAPSASSREPSTWSDDTASTERVQTDTPTGPAHNSPPRTVEPDVIASTKANSLRASGASVVVVSPLLSAPVAPPRRKRRNRLHGSQSLSTTDGDNLSVRTTDTDDYNYPTSRNVDNYRQSTRSADDYHNMSRSNDDYRHTTRSNDEFRHTTRSADDYCLTKSNDEYRQASKNNDEFRQPSRNNEEFRQSSRNNDDYRQPTRSNDEYRQTSRSNEDYRQVISSRPDKPNLDELLNESSLSEILSNQSVPLPSPASTIESLTREFQDSLELSNIKYDKSERERHSSDRTSSSSKNSAILKSKDKDIKDTSKGGSVRPADEDKSRNVGVRTQSESRTGHSSLGSSGRHSSQSSERRRSAGDEAGLPLTDIQILEQVTVLNLDTGERVPLSVAEHKLPQCINPLSLHIMRITSEYIASSTNDENIRETDEESESVCAGGGEEMKEAKSESSDRQSTAIRRKTEKFKRFLGSTVKKTVDAAKSLAQEVSHARHKEDVADITDDVRGEHNIKLKASNSHKGPYDFDGCVRHVQEMESAHTGAIWSCKFSVCGRLLATAGQDRMLRVWVTRDAYQAFHDLRLKYNKCKSSPSPSEESLSSIESDGQSPAPHAIFCDTPFAVYCGHTSDLLDLSWSKNYFILSSSMDKTVRLWHVGRGECLCCFQHIDFVTAIVFHPRDDRYFLSGSLDGKLRLWNIPDKKVSMWNEVGGKTKLITAANFCQNGKFAVVGTYDGRCIFYTSDQLKYHTQIDVRSTRGKNVGRKISGIEPMPNDDKILVTSNDSRIRLYDLRDLNLSCKYKGYVNVSSQIKASFSHDGKYIVSGSENQCIYIWKTLHDYSKFTSVRRDRNDFWEGIKAHNAVVTCAVFAPSPDNLIRAMTEREEAAKAANKDGDKESVKTQESGMVASSQSGHVLVSADFNGCIKVFVHKAKPKHSSLPASALT